MDTVNCCTSMKCAEYVLGALGEANPGSRNLGGGFGNCLGVGLMLLIEVNTKANTDFKGKGTPRVNFGDSWDTFSIFQYLH